MATYRTPLEKFPHMIWKSTDAGATADIDVFGGPCTLYSLKMINSVGGAAPAYIKIYDALSATYQDRPVLAFYMLNGGDRTVQFAEGFKFTYGLTIRCTTHPMIHTASDGTDPTQNVTIIAVGKGD